MSFLFVAIQSALYAQPQDLSEEGYRHWCGAIVLMEDIREDSDYFLVLNEFLKVTEADSTSADVYFNMGFTYFKIGESGGGVPYFENAKKSYEKCLALMPSEKATIIKELARVEIKMERFIAANIRFACGIQIQREDLYNKKTLWDKSICPDGWRLPTREELKCMCREEQRIGNFKSGSYSNYFTSEFDEKGNIYIRSFDDCKESRENVNNEKGWIRCVKDDDLN
jgi:tetratricopeptide (TPR) repeat protein